VTFESGFADAERAAVAGKGDRNPCGGHEAIAQSYVGWGHLQDRKSSDRLVTILESTRQEVQNARSAWPFSPESEEQYLRESFAPR